MSDGNRAPVGIDPTRPNAARVYNYMLGGKDNYEVDQMVAHRMLAVAPDTKTLAWFSRRFLLQAVEMAAEQGIRQFLDIGAGIPISPNVHEVAQEIQPSARVISIDYDPVVHVHSNALLANVTGVTPILADIRDTDEIIEKVRAEHLIDWDEPVAILVVGVLHFIMDDEHPEEIVARFRNEMAPGSYFALTHASDHTTTDFMTTTRSDTVGSPAQVRYRDPISVARLLDGFELVDPGVRPVQDWIDRALPQTKLVILGGIGRIPEA